VRASSDLASSL
jgi:hypothetical protein